MTKAIGIELSEYSYAAEQFAALHRPDLSMSIPTMDVPKVGSLILLHSYDRHKDESIARLNVRVDTPGENVTLFRADGLPIQGQDVFAARPPEGTPMFAEPIPSLSIYKQKSGIWCVGVDHDNIQDMHTFEEFLGIASMFAVSKQDKLDKTDVLFQHFSAGHNK